MKKLLNRIFKALVITVLLLATAIGGATLSYILTKQGMGKMAADVISVFTCVFFSFFILGEE